MSAQKWTLPVPPAGCWTSEDEERWLTAVSDEYLAMGKSLAVPTGKRGRPSHLPAIKAFEAALKAARVAQQLTEKRENREYVEALAIKAQELRGGGQVAENRARLRRGPRMVAAAAPAR